jgi:hypothetical protein
MLVAEKQGRVWSVMNGVKNSTPMLAIQSKVLDEHDRGFLGMAIDPNYAVNRFVYFMYTVDPDSDSVDDDDEAYGRIVRYTVSASDSNVVDPNSRVVLLGHNWRNGPLIASPSHTIGCLRFGTDGSLLATVGDGAQYANMDQGGQDPNGFGTTKTDPYEDIGAFRAQYIGSLCGKLLRINPATGQGYTSNPFYDGNLASVQSRVFAYGLRNRSASTCGPAAAAPIRASASRCGLHRAGRLEQLGEADGRDSGRPQLRLAVLRGRRHAAELSERLARASRLHHDPESLAVHDRDRDLEPRRPGGRHAAGLHGQLRDRRGVLYRQHVPVAVPQSVLLRRLRRQLDQGRGRQLEQSAPAGHGLRDRRGRAGGFRRQSGQR